MDEKRTEAVRVNCTESEWRLLKRAAVKQWPGAILSRAAIVLGLALIGARSVLGRQK